MYKSVCFKSENREKNVPVFVPKRVYRVWKGVFLSHVPYTALSARLSARKRAKNRLGRGTVANALRARKMRRCARRESVLR